MGDAKRVDLDALLRLRNRINNSGGTFADSAIVQAFDDAIAEIEAARATPPSPSLSSGTTLDLMRFAIDAAQTLAHGIVDALAAHYEAGPSRAERLVAYRCAALTGIAVRYAEPPDEILPERAETWAHAMLAAEREPQR